MVISNKLKELVKHFEACKLTSYVCSAGHNTIGYGNTFYENGIKVKPGDKITQQRAEELLDVILIKFVQQTNELIKSNVNQNQRDELTDFAYNCGVGNLKTSTLLKKVNKDPNDKSIKLEFIKWVNADGTHNGKDDDGDGLIDEKGEMQKLNGLFKRRNAEANLYFS
jgi:lysozyme